MMEQTSSTSKHVSTGQRVTKWQKCQEWALASSSSSKEVIFINLGFTKLSKIKQLTDIGHI
jgi:hypothetical protein